MPSHLAVYPFFPKPALQGLMSMFGKWVVRGQANLPAEEVVSGKYPEVKPKKISDVLALWKEKGVNGQQQKVNL